jgi:hypothetical protein
MSSSDNDARLDKPYWRGMYAIALVLGIVVSIGVIVAAAARFTD